MALQPSTAINVDSLVCPSVRRRSVTTRDAKMLQNVFVYGCLQINDEFEIRTLLNNHCAKLHPTQSNGGGGGGGEISLAFHVLCEFSRSEFSML